MLQRFVAGTAIASILIALGAFIIVLTPALTVQRLYPLPLMWCFVPVVWGLWAMCTPSKLMPLRLPLWGTLLGLIVGVMAVFVLRFPLRVLGAAAPVVALAVGVIVVAAIYYLLWMLVRSVYCSLTATSGTVKAATTAGRK